MENNNEDRNQQAGKSTDNKDQQATSSNNDQQNKMDENPQEGSEWGNYRTRELSSKEDDADKEGSRDLNPSNA
ncbi:MAG: hypothetical protein ABIN57_04845 [Chitinophagaceae bacterium]